MKIKLTAAQCELLRTHPDFEPVDGVLEISDNQLPQLIADIDDASACIDALPYSQEVARAKFAAKYLARKLHKLAEPQPEPEPPAPIEIGATVYLVTDKTCTYRVVKFNTDGSVQVYGGESPQYRKYRDLPLEALTTQK